MPIVAPSDDVFILDVRAGRKAMDYRTALIEFSNLLKIGASSLAELNAAAQSPYPFEIYRREISAIADRLREIGECIAETASHQKI